MPLVYLDHVNLRTAHLARMTEFYCQILGLRSGPRPAFPFGGAWLYCGERPVLHLVEVAEQPSPTGELRMEHFAFVARDFDEFVRKLDAAGIAYRSSKLFGSETRQLNVHDPDGNRVHLDFPEYLGVATHLAK
jgi:catechol 2,3-dioxygenase-like lactoylglutathione lyase family enzyme